jgi:hypothetical protein
LGMDQGSIQEREPGRDRRWVCPGGPHGSDCQAADPDMGQSGSGADNILYLVVEYLRDDRHCTDAYQPTAVGRGEGDTARSFYDTLRDWGGKRRYPAGAWVWTGRPRDGHGIQQAGHILAYPTLRSATYLARITRAGAGARLRATRLDIGIF